MHNINFDYKKTPQFCNAQKLWDKRDDARLLPNRNRPETIEKPRINRG